MDINKYILFADVAATKNFTKSGERMGYTQPGVSHVLKAMERELASITLADVHEDAKKYIQM